MKKQSFLRYLAIAVTLLLLIASSAIAFNGGTTADVWQDGTATVITTSPLTASSSNLGSGCTSHTGTIFLKYDISSILGEPVTNKSIGSASLTITTAATGSNPVQGTLTLYSTTGDGTFTDSGGTVPALDSSLSTATVGPGNPGSGTAINFPTSAAFVTYVQSQSSASGAFPAADNVVTFAIRFSACGSLNLQTFQDNTGTAPTLSLENPNAIELLELNVESRTPSSQWIQTIGMAALALFAVVTLSLVARRRRA